MATRNPIWARDELILALDLYFRYNPGRISRNHPKVIELSQVLNGLEIHSQRADDPTFRNPNGVYMKMCNFRRVDPSFEGSGLSRGGGLEEQVWEEFASDRERLRRIAAAIKQSIGELSRLQPIGEEEAPEGRLLLRMHKVRERKPSLVAKKKRQALRSLGRLSCEACGFDFLGFYGQLGEGFIECHHKLPFSQLPSVRTTRLEDLALVCANCHRMLHRGGETLTVEALRALLPQTMA